MPFVLLKFTLYIDKQKLNDFFIDANSSKKFDKLFMLFFC